MGGIEIANALVKERNKLQLKSFRSLAIKYLGGCCLVCKKTSNLHIHHIDCNWKNNDETNLAILCKDCHYDVHFIIENKLSNANLDDKVTLVRITKVRNTTLRELIDPAIRAKKRGHPIGGKNHPDVREYWRNYQNEFRTKKLLEDAQKNAK